MLSSVTSIALKDTVAILVLVCIKSCGVVPTFIENEIELVPYSGPSASVGVKVDPPVTVHELSLTPPDTVASLVESYDKTIFKKLIALVLAGSTKISKLISSPFLILGFGGEKEREVAAVALL